MKKCAFLTMDNLENFVCYDTLLVAPLAELGWNVDFVSWRSTDPDWDKYEVVVIRSPWDYQQNPEKFLGVLDDIDRSSAHLENSLELVRSNINKNYLCDLESQGVDIVPTLWPVTFTTDLYVDFFNKLGTDEIVIKPLVSANADNTFRLTRNAKPALISQLEEIFTKRDFMVQPFMPHILDEGEFSLFFFGGRYSHTILKTPKSNDFRVQEEHGGTLQLVEPEPALLAHAKDVMKTIQPVPLYARVDSVRDPADNFLLMELELIEPSLYFNMDPESPKRFARIFDNWIHSKIRADGLK